MAVAVEHLVWRATLAGAPAVPGWQELAAWAPHLGEDGAVLRDCAALLHGFSPEAAAFRARGWRPPGAGAQSTPPGKSDSTIDVAIRELEEAARDFSPTLAAVEQPAFSGRPDAPAGIGPGIPAGPLPGDLAATAAALMALLSDPDLSDPAALADLLERLAEAGRRLPRLDYRQHADAAPPLLAASLAAAVLIDFAGATRDLACRPLGSPALLHRSARFAVAGLGPYFGNIGRVVRDSGDVFDLARRAAAASGRADEDAVGAWIALLSRGCHGPLLRQLIDDLADHAATAPLVAILDRAAGARDAAIDEGLIRYLRDAALDIGDYRTAARAQATIVRLRPGDVLELEILGTIHAGAGELVEAEAAFRGSLALAPDHAGVRARLDTLGTAAFEPFAIDRGFGSPADRVDQRLVRRGARLDYPQRRGGRIVAVDVA